MSIGFQSAQELLTLAVQKGAGVDTLERLMDLRDRVLREEAKKAFNKAMASFQAECPVIKKTKAVKTKSGQTAYKYAPIESAVAQVKNLVQKHGFRYTTTMQFLKAADGSTTVKAFCRVVHELGHEEVSEMEVPLGNKTDIMSQSQVVAAASTFAKRYAFLNAFGIMTGDEDNDTASERGDQPGAKDETPKGDQKQAPPPVKKERPPRGVPYYDPEEDDGGSMTPKQRAFMTKRWGEYMDKTGITANDERAARFEKFVPWAFQKFGKKATVDTLTIQQASYLIDFIPTLPVKGKEPPAAPPEPPPATPPPPAPAAPPRPAAPVELTPEEVTAYHETLREQPDLASLEATWKQVLEVKKQGRIGKHFVELHQTYIRTRSALK